MTSARYRNAERSPC